MKSTFLMKPADVQKKWYIIDAEGKILGRVATQVATILRGKHRPTYTPNVDCGDNVIVINAEKAILSGKKLDNKFYYRHTGHIGGMKATSYRELMEKKPEQAMMLAIKGMLPKNSLGRKMLTNVRIYRGSEHEQAAQKPEVYNG
ncbi:MAG: 50S ribosomal protein L13 [Clostridia bacterium]|nr:50S ribosomal protein L13 [Oscillospiraceae bacterium]MBR4892787.1 50S ribosomal protein L13 [Clostridia bacterium]